MSAAAVLQGRMQLLRRTAIQWHITSQIHFFMCVPQNHLQQREAANSSTTSHPPSDLDPVRASQLLFRSALQAFESFPEQVIGQDYPHLTSAIIGLAGPGYLRELCYVRPPSLPPIPEEAPVQPLANNESAAAGPLDTPASGEPDSQREADGAVDESSAWDAGPHPPTPLPGMFNLASGRAVEISNACQAQARQVLGDILSSPPVAEPAAASAQIEANPPSGDLPPVDKSSIVVSERKQSGGMKGDMLSACWNGHGLSFLLTIVGHSSDNKADSGRRCGAEHAGSSANRAAPGGPVWLLQLCKRPQCCRQL